MDLDRESSGATWSVFGPCLRHHVYNCQGCVVFGGSPSLRANGNCPRAYEVCDGSEAGGIFVSAFAARRRIHIQHTHSLHSAVLQGISMKGLGQVRWKLLCVCVCQGHEAGWVCSFNYRVPVTEAEIEQWTHEHTWNTLQEAANGSKMCSCWWFSDKNTTDSLFRTVFSGFYAWFNAFQCPFTVRSLRAHGSCRKKCEYLKGGAGSCKGLRVLLVGEVLHQFNCTRKNTLVLHWCCLWLWAQKGSNDTHHWPGGYRGCTTLSKLYL